MSPLRKRLRKRLPSKPLAWNQGGAPTVHPLFFADFPVSELSLMGQFATIGITKSIHRETMLTSYGH